MHGKRSSCASCPESEKNQAECSAADAFRSNVGKATTFLCSPGPVLLRMFRRKAMLRHAQNTEIHPPDRNRLASSQYSIHPVWRWFGSLERNTAAGAIENVVLTRSTSWEGRMSFIRVQNLVRGEDGEVLSGSAAIMDTVYAPGAHGHAKHTVVENLGKVVYFDKQLKLGIFQSPIRGLVEYCSTTGEFKDVALDDPRLPPKLVPVEPNLHTMFGDA